MATPVKTKKSEVAKPATPYTSARVTRLRTPKKSEDKRVERDRRKAEDVALTRSGRKVASGRKPAKPKNQEQDDKQSEDEKHVKWEDHETLSSKESSEQSEGEEYDTPALVEDEKLEAAGSVEEETDKSKDNVKEEKNDPTVVKSESDSDEVPKPAPIKAPQDTHTTSSDNNKTENHRVQQEKHKPAEPTDELSLEAKRREEQILQRYHQQWAMENERRQRITEAETARRLRVAKKIDGELERSMAEEYNQRDPKKAPRASTTTSSPLLPSTYTVIKIEEDSDDEPTESTDRESAVNELQAKLKSLSQQLNEKEDYIRKLESERTEMAVKDEKRGEHVAKVLVELEASSKEEKKGLEGEVLSMMEKIKTLEEKLAGSSDPDKTKLVEDLADQLELANKNIAERAQIVDMANQTLYTETELLLLEKRQFEEEYQKWQSGKDELEKELREAKAIAIEMKSQHEAQEKTINEEVNRRVKEAIRALKEERRKQREEEQRRATGTDHPSLVPFTGVPISNYSGSGTIPGLIEPPPSTYSLDSNVVGEEVTESGAVPVETQDKGEPEGDEVVNEENGEENQYGEDGGEYYTGEEEIEGEEIEGEIEGEEIEGEVPEIEEEHVDDRKRKRGEIDDTEEHDVDENDEEQDTGRTKASKIRRVLGSVVLGIPAVAALAAAGFHVALDMSASGF